MCSLMAESWPDGVAKEVVERHLSAVLSGRELEVAQLAVSGLSTAEMARRLFVTLNTVKTHVRHILRKTGAANRQELTQRLLEVSQASAEVTFLHTDRYAHHRDPLTGLLSQDAFGQMVTAVQRADEGQGLSVILLQMEGTAILSPLDLVKVDLAVTHILATTVRSRDLVFRWADTQFIIVLPSVDREVAREVGMRLAICLSRWAQEHGLDLLFSLSCSSSFEGISSAHGLVELAQKRLNLTLRDSA